MFLNRDISKIKMLWLRKINFYNVDHKNIDKWGQYGFTMALELVIKELKILCILKTN